MPRPFTALGDLDPRRVDGPFGLGPGGAHGPRPLHESLRAFFQNPIMEIAVNFQMKRLSTMSALRFNAEGEILIS